MKYKIFMLSYIVSSSKSPACKARLFHHHQRTAWRLHLFSHTIIVWFRFMPSLILITKKVVSPALLSPSTSSATSRTLPPSKNEHPNLVFHSWKCPKCNYTNYIRTSLGQTSAWYAILSIVKSAWNRYTSTWFHLQVPLLHQMPPSKKITWESGIAMIVTTRIIPTSPLQYFVTT